MKKTIIYILLFMNILYSNEVKYENVNLKLSNNNINENIGFLIAKEKGFYKNENINLNIINSDFNTFDEEKILKGEYDFAVGSPNLIKKIMSKKELFLLSPIYQQSSLILLSSTNVDEFSDRIVAIESGTDISALELFIILNNLDIHYFDKKNKEIIHQKFLDGEIMYLGMDSLSIPKKFENNNIIYEDTYNSGVHFYDKLLYTSSQFYKKNPILVEKFNTQSKKGFLYAFNNIEESAKLLTPYIQNKNLEQIKINLKRLKSYAVDKNNSFATFNKINLEEMMRHYNLLGIKTQTNIFKNHILNEQNKIKVSFRTRPPHMFIKNNAPHGPMIDILKQVAKEMNKEIIWEFQPFNKSLTDIKDGSLDILPRAFYTKDREKFMDFVGPVKKSKKDVKFYLRKKDNRKLEKYEDLKQFNIAVFDKGFYFERFNKDNTLNKIPVSTYHEMVSLLENGHIDVIASYANLTIENALKKENIDYKIASFMKTDIISDYFGVSKETSILNLSESIQKTIFKMEEKGLLKEIYKSYELEDIGLTKEEKDWIRDNTIKVSGASFDSAPYYFSDKKKNEKTIPSEFLNLISEKTGLKIEKKQIRSWDQLLNSFKDKKIDLIPAIYYEKDRESFGNYSSSYSKVFEQFLY